MRVYTPEGATGIILDTALTLDSTTITATTENGHTATCDVNIT